MQLNGRNYATGGLKYQANIYLGTRHFKKKTCQEKFAFANSLVVQNYNLIKIRASSLPHVVHMAMLCDQRRAKENLNRIKQKIR